MRYPPEKTFHIGSVYGVCIQDEIHRKAQARSHVKSVEDEEKISLSSQGTKSKGKKRSGGGEPSSKGKKKKKDLNKIKCFSYHWFGNYATNAVVGRKVQEGQSSSLYRD